MRFGEAELRAMLDALGVDLTCYLSGVAYATRGVIDEADDDMLPAVEGEFAGRRRTILVEASALPAIGEGTAVVVDGSDYTVVQTRLVDDGLLLRLYLA